MAWQPLSILALLAAVAAALWLVFAHDDVSAAIQKLGLTPVVAVTAP